MDLDNVYSGHLYAVKTRPCWFEPFIAVDTEEGLRLLPAAEANVEIMLPDGTLNWEARTTKPSEDLSNWLRKSEDWPGSSSSVFYDSDGKFSGSFVTLFTGNPYQLAMLLTWLGTPAEIIKNITGIESA